MASNFYLWSLQSALLHKYYERLCFSMTQVDGAGLRTAQLVFNYLTSYIWSTVILQLSQEQSKRLPGDGTDSSNDSLLLHVDHIIITTSANIWKHLITDPNFDLEPRPDCSSAVTKWNQTCWLLCGSVKFKVYWYKCVINVLHAEGAFTNRMDTKRHKFTTIRSKRETNQLSAVFISNRRVQISNNTDLILTLQ